MDGGSGRQTRVRSVRGAATPSESLGRGNRPIGLGIDAVARAGERARGTPRGMRTWTAGARAAMADMADMLRREKLDTERGSSFRAS